MFCKTKICSYCIHSATKFFCHIITHYASNTLYLYSNPYLFSHSRIPVPWQISVLSVGGWRSRALGCATGNAHSEWPVLHTDRVDGCAAVSEYDRAWCPVQDDTHETVGRIWGVLQPRHSKLETMHVYVARHRCVKTNNFIKCLNVYNFRCDAGNVNMSDREMFSMKFSMHLSL